MTLSFVIPVKNDRVRLGRLLQSIAAAAAASRIEPEVIVVDNGSTDGSGPAAESLGARVMQFSVGTVAELRNQAAATARGDVLAFVDADHTIAPRWIAIAEEVFRDPAVAAAGALCLAPPQPTWVQRAYDRLRRRPAGTRVVEWLGSGNLLVRRAIFAQAQGFDTSLQTCEDVDLCRRIRQGGHAVVSDDRFENVHWGDPATIKALFFGELWRGRDNLRVAWRGGWREFISPSVAMPLMLLAALIGLAASPLLAHRGAVALASTLVLGLVVGARSAAMVSSRPPASPAELAQIAVVATTYELARALALVIRPGHATRRVPASRVA